MPADVDPELQKQLRRAGDGGNVKAIVALDMTQGATSSSSPSHERILDRVSQEVGENPREVTSLGHLGVVIVEGSGRYVRHLLRQDEVVSASASESGSGSEEAEDD
ncbi:MAG: hypothetical protein JWM17_2062 [Actinobacteria bacterium]|jgi:hypothetical protein|nr:hypothetical protein [Actinomycetota bacterium]MEA2503463.1 hypothetical protein [Actinomycetota bacterium]